MGSLMHIHASSTCDAGPVWCYEETCLPPLPHSLSLHISPCHTLLPACYAHRPHLNTQRLGRFVQVQQPLIGIL